MLPLSVIIPTYKPSDYLWQTLDSLTQQTLDTASYEVIIVLNGPRDPYHQAIAHYITAQPSTSESKLEVNIHLLYNPEAGVSAARNFGIEAAQGRYLAFIDDDDWVSPNYLSHLLTVAERYASVSQPHYIVQANVVDYDGANYTDDYITRAYKRCSVLPTISLLRGRSFLSSSCCKLIPRSVIAQTRYPIGIAHGEDSLYMAALSPRIRAIYLTPSNAIYYRRVHPQSAQYVHRTLSIRLRDTMCVVLRYLPMLLQPWHYQPLFILTRIAATIRRFCRGL